MTAAKRARAFTLGHDAGLSAESLDQISSDLIELAGQYEVRSLSDILGDLVELQDSVFGIVETRKLRPQQARQLYLIGGIATGLLAKASHDYGRPHDAMTQARAAHLCAEQSDHDGLRAWLCGMQALISYWAGRHQSAIRYAQQGTLFAERSRSSAGVWVAASEARSWAAIGNEEEVHAAIERAQRARDAIEDGDELDSIAGICSFGETRQTYYTADALTLLPNQERQAEAVSEDALRSYLRSSGAPFGDTAGAASDLAVARIRNQSPDFEGASEALAHVLALPPSQRITGVVHSVHRVRSAIAGSAAPTDPQAVEIVASIDDFTGVTAASIQNA